MALLDGAASPLAGIEAVLLDFAKNPRRLGTASCLGVSSICEFGRSDAAVAACNDEFGKVFDKAFERQIKKAIDAGEIDGSLPPREAARFLTTTLGGMKVAGAAGDTPAHLTSVARMALRSLR